jgi:hypothetical protein
MATEQGPTRAPSDTPLTTGNPDRLPLPCIAFDLVPLARDRHRARPDAGSLFALWEPSLIETTKKPPDRLLVTCIAFDLAPLARDRH